MAAKKTVTVVRPFKDRDGKDHRIGERIEVDSDYAQEIIKDGSAQENPEPEQPK